MLFVVLKVRRNNYILYSNYVGKCKKEVVDVIRKYFGLVVEDYDTPIMETTAYEMTAALSILNILLENGYDKSELSGKYVHSP